MVESDEDRVARLREDERQRRRRSIAIALVLGGLVVLFFLMSIVQLHGRFG
ncbi:MAG TPA: hypothetical protein VHL34_14740 [Rhizomicrobium sp.]|jgi:hypothetical protein|nr:hypothetical protein [Rhizomicrobium sp.]